ncbi:hypothetical protein ACLB1Q_16505 [Escherichia coli]
MKWPFLTRILKRAADSYRRIRNTARFLLANLNGFDPAKDMVKPEEMVVLDGCGRRLCESGAEASSRRTKHTISTKWYSV